MVRVTNAPASRKRRKRRLKMARGYYGARSRLYRTATEAVDRAMAMAYAHRKRKKRDFRSLWITRISAACRARSITYSRFMSGLRKAGIDLNRKMLSETAIRDPEAFDQLVERARQSLKQD